MGAHSRGALGQFLILGWGLIQGGCFFEGGANSRIYGGAEGRLSSVINQSITSISQSISHNSHYIIITNNQSIKQLIINQYQSANLKYNYVMCSKIN